MTNALNSESLLYIGIDDTDNPNTRGTGFRARQLIRQLADSGLAEALAVTRHQLFVDDRIPYTSHNSSACLVVRPASDSTLNGIGDLCRGYLLHEAAPGSDVGLCIATPAQAGQLTAFARRARCEVLEQDEARQLAADNGHLLEGLTGDYQGIIGATAAVGLHVEGDDGRYIWAPGIRELKGSTLTKESLLADTAVTSILDANLVPVAECSYEVQLGNWPRPVRVNGEAALLVEPVEASSGAYRVLDKQRIKAIRP